MTFEDVRAYEKELQQQTNKKVMGETEENLKGETTPES